MRNFQIVTTVFCLAALSTIVAPLAQADTWNRKTEITFSEPVEIPGVHLAGWGVLPAGTYVFKILDSQSDRHIVQIFRSLKTRSVNRSEYCGESSIGRCRGKSFQSSGTSDQGSGRKRKPRC